MGSKKLVLKFRSVKSIVIAPAKTGRDSKSKITVIKIDQTNNGIRSEVKFLLRMFIIVDIKLMAPKIELTPAKCKEKIVKSTELPAWAKLFDRGG